MGSQISDVLNHLQNIGGLTNKDGYDLYGIERLSGIIYVLRGRGYNIVTHMMEGTNRHGHTCRYGKYVLRK